MGEINVTSPTPGVGNVHVTPEQLTAMATKCTNAADNIYTGLNNLLERIQGLSGVGLAGQANNALQSSSTQLGSGLGKVLDALTGLAGQISSANVRLSVQDEDAAQMILTAAAGATDQTVLNTLRGA